MPLEIRRKLGVNCQSRHEYAEDSAVGSHERDADRLKHRLAVGSGLNPRPPGSLPLQSDSDQRSLRHIVAGRIRIVCPGAQNSLGVGDESPSGGALVAKLTSLVQ